MSFIVGTYRPVPGAPAELEWGSRHALRVVAWQHYHLLLAGLLVRGLHLERTEEQPYQGEAVVYNGIDGARVLALSAELPLA